MKFFQRLFGKKVKKSKNNEIKNIRLALGMTQIKFAEKIGMSRATVASWEMGRRNPAERQKAKIDKLINEVKNLEEYN